MRAFNNDKKIKKALVSEARKHRELDRLVQGAYSEVKHGTFKGCAVGCTIHSFRLLANKSYGYSDHSAYEDFGIPEILAHIEDRIFEGLPISESKDWPEKFLSAIPVGADLSGVWPRFAHWLMVDPDHGVLRFANGREDVSAAILGVAALYANGCMPTDVDAVDAAVAAAAAKYAAASAAAAAKYASAAGNAAAAAKYASAAGNAVDAAKYASAAGNAAANEAARSAEYLAQSEKLIQLLKEAA